MHLLESSEQDLFNAAVRGLASQGWVRCSVANGYNRRCVYNGPNGTHCAVGWCITDIPPGNYNNKACVGELLYELYGVDANDRDVIERAEQFLTAMQAAHDQSADSYMATRFATFAESHNLGWPDDVPHPLAEK